MSDSLLDRILIGVRRQASSRRRHGLALDRRCVARYIGLVDASYELFDHTADMGLRIRAGSLDGLLEPASRALYAAIGSLVPGDERRERRLTLADGTAADLLRDFLTELLVAFERESLMVAAVKHASFTDARLDAELVMSKVRVDQSSLEREVKAITYHELEIRPIPGGVEATIIVDI